VITRMECVVALENRMIARRRGGFFRLQTRSGRVAHRVNPNAKTWPLHDIVSSNIVWCMPYEREFEGGSYIAQ